MGSLIDNHREQLCRGRSWARLCAILTLIIVAAHSAHAADHNDAPGIGGAAGSLVDITDVFVFRSPSDSNNLVIAVGHFSPEVAVNPPLFDSLGRYEIYIDTDLDYIPDTTITATFDDGVSGAQSYHIQGVPGAAGTITGDVSLGADAQVSASGRARAFCGLRDDHFFFDLNAFKAFEAAPCIPSAGLRCPGTGTPQNFFAGRNTASIIVEFPLTSLPRINSPDSGNLHIWSKTFSPEIS